MTAASNLPDSGGQDTKFPPSCGPLSRGAAAFGLAVGVLTLLGWFFDVGGLLQASPNRVMMDTNAALAFVLSGIALWGIGNGRAGRVARNVALTCALGVALIGALTLIEHVTGRNLGIDGILAVGAAGRAGLPGTGRMAPTAALNFFLLGTSLVLLSRQRGYRTVSAMAFVAGALGLLAVLGYAYADEPSVSLAAYTRMAFQSALTFTVLAAGVLVATGDRGLMEPLFRDGVGGVMARRILPAVLLVPLLLQWLRRAGEHVGLFGDEFGVALMVVASMAVLALVVRRDAVDLNRADAERRLAAESLKRHERELARTTEVLETIFANVQFMVVYLDSRFNFIRVNPAYAEACGHPVEFFPGKNHFDLYPNAENETIFRRAVETGKPFSVFAKPFEYPDRPERGVTYWDWSVQPVKEADGTVGSLIFCLRDVTESVRAEFRLGESERRLEMAIAGADLGLWEWSGRGRGSLFVDKLAGMLGYSAREIEPSPAAWRRLVHPDDLRESVAQIAAHLEGRTPYYEAEFRMRAKSGGWHWIYTRGKVFERDADGRPLRATGIHQDVTRAKELELTVLRQEKLAVLGQLAAGIAHEIRNPLSGMNIYLSTAEAIANETAVPDAGSRERLRRALVTARSASVRIEGVIRRVMDFVKLSPSRAGLIQVNDIVAESLELAAATLRNRGVRLATTLSEGLPACRADSRLVEQLLLNLVTNAAQAMENQKREKVIEIATGREGNAVVVTVADSGPGVPEELREKIFEPFFTTKHAGTGLGLSISRRIASEHGGSLEVGKGRLGGAEFRVVLPIGETNPSAGPAATAGARAD